MSRKSKGKKAAYEQCYKRHPFAPLHTTSFRYRFTVALPKLVDFSRSAPIPCAFRRRWLHQDLGTSLRKKSLNLGLRKILFPTTQPGRAGCSEA
jgi:hypothetical protein